VHQKLVVAFVVLMIAYHAMQSNYYGKSIIMKNTHFEQRRKEIEMYQAGVTCGIRFVIDRLLARFSDDIRNQVVDLLDEEYRNE
jgi:hypothetical protein